MRSIATAALAATLALGVVTPAHAAPPSPRDGLDTYVVSTQPSTLPEGIDVTPDGRIFVGSIGGGVFAGHVGTPTLTSLGTQPYTFGTHVDQRDRVWVAAWGQVLVLNTDGSVIKAIPLPDEDAAANDLVITNKAVYITDMNSGRIYVIDLQGDKIGELSTFLDARDLGLDPTKVGWNGIVASPNGKTLIVSALGLGQLYVVDVATGEAQRMDVTLPGGADGMELKGNTLYAVLNGEGMAPADRGVYAIKLSKDYLSGTIAAKTTGSVFNYPTTLALYKDEVFVVNGQFDRWPGTPPYTITVIPDPCSSTKAC